MTSSYDTHKVSVGCVHGSNRLYGSIVAEDTETLIEAIQDLYDKETDR